MLMYLIINKLLFCWLLLLLLLLLPLLLHLQQYI